MGTSYDYTIAYKPGEQHGNADPLSLLPLPEAPKDVSVSPETIMLIMLMESLSSCLVTAAHIKQWTTKDPVLLKVKDFVLRGWHNPKNQGGVSVYYMYRNELSVSAARESHHHTTSGERAGDGSATRMTPRKHKNEGISVWWPGHGGENDACQRMRHSPAPAPLHLWEFPKRPEILHADFAGPFQGKMFLILIDAHSKWLEVKPLSAATSTTTIEHLRSIFATHGLPEEFVTDNGTQFTSAEFEAFMKNNGIRHIKLSSYHPASNGLAERVVQCFKESMKKFSNAESLET